jgi:hemolysin III
VTHQWAFVGSILIGIALVLSAPSARARLAAAIYAVSVAALFGSSALYHRVAWRSPGARRWMRRLDHSMIFVLIAGTYTPFALLALRGALADALLIAVWAGAAAGIVLRLAWIDAPESLVALVYVLLGWLGAAAVPTLIATLGTGPTALVAGGGVLYTVGAVVYVRKRPDPGPRRLRLSRGLPRARDRRGRSAVRGDRVLCAARGARVARPRQALGGPARRSGQVERLIADRAVSSPHPTHC